MLVSWVLTLASSVIASAARSAVWTSNTGISLEKHQWTKRDWNLQECEEDERSVINTAIQRVRGMLEASLDQLAQYNSFLISRENLPDTTQNVNQNDDDQLPTFLRTFAKLYCPNENCDATNEDNSGEEYEQVKHTAVEKKELLSEELMNGIDKTRRLKIICGDDWLLDRRPDGELPTSGPEYKIDSRLSRNNREIHWPRRWGDPATDSTPGALNSVLLHRKTISARYDVLVLKKSMFKKWKENLSIKKRLTAVEREIKPEEMPIEDLVQDRLEIVLLHHFSQAESMLPPGWKRDTLKLRTVDEYNKPPDNIGPFGWINATRLAEQDTSAASENADNFVFLTLALFLNKWDWADGRNRKIPDLLWRGESPFWRPPFPKPRPRRPSPESASPGPQELDFESDDSNFQDDDPFG